MLVGLPESAVHGWQSEPVLLIYGQRVRHILRELQRYSDVSIWMLIFWESETRRDEFEFPLLLILLFGPQGNFLGLPYVDSFSPLSQKLIVLTPSFVSVTSNASTSRECYLDGKFEM